MKSPYKHGWGHYEDPFNLREIPLEEERLITQGYNFLGWRNGWGEENPTEYRTCINLAHNYKTAFPNAWQEALHSPRGSDTTQWCTICKIYWKTDMSD